jgi:quercetin dioxygenase-like cupin family protein/GNAT superfamily N-acetyltransferase
MFRTSR